MICPNCGQNVPDGSDFCKFCGKPTQFSARMNYRTGGLPAEAAGDASLRGELDALYARLNGVPGKAELLALKKRQLLLCVITVVICFTLCAASIAITSSIAANLRSATAAATVGNDGGALHAEDGKQEEPPSAVSTPQAAEEAEGAPGNGAGSPASEPAGE